MIAAGLVAVATTGVATALLSGGEDPAFKPGATGLRAPDRSFAVALPSGWRAIVRESVGDLPARPAAVLQRADRRGLVVISRRPPLARSRQSLTRQLTRQLRAACPTCGPSRPAWYR